MEGEACKQASKQLGRAIGWAMLLSSSSVQFNAMRKWGFFFRGQAPSLSAGKRRLLKTVSLGGRQCLTRLVTAPRKCNLGLSSLRRKERRGVPHFGPFYWFPVRQLAEQVLVTLTWPSPRRRIFFLLFVWFPVDNEFPFTGWFLAL